MSAPEITKNILLPKACSIPSPNEQAKMLSSHYASMSHLPPKHATRFLQRRLSRLDIKQNLTPQFTTAEVIVSLRDMESSKTPGPYDVPYDNCIPHGIRSFIGIYNQFIMLKAIPSIWSIDYDSPRKPDKPYHLLLSLIDAPLFFVLPRKPYRGIFSIRYHFSFLSIYCFTYC